MLFFYECARCKWQSGLLRAEELPSSLPACPNSGCKNKTSKVSKKSTYVFALHCRQCNKTYPTRSATDFDQLSQTSLKCAHCNSTKITLVPPTISSAERKKRKAPGQLSVEDRKHVALFDQGHDKLVIAPVLSSAGKNKRLKLAAPPGKASAFPSNSPIANLARVESEHQLVVRDQKRFVQRYGVLKDAQNPKLAASHSGRDVLLSAYQTQLQNRESIDGVDYPKLSASAPTIVNDVKIIRRDAVWDYRELGPNSLLRRLSTLLYVVQFDKGPTWNPVEVQAMWAHGSLFLSSNNLKYSTRLHAEIKTQGSLAELLAKIGLSTASSAFPTKMRNLKAPHKNRLPEYQQAFVDRRYPSYFRLPWKFVNKAIEAVIHGASGTTLADPIVVLNSNQGFQMWQLTPSQTIESGKIYVVLPNKASSSSSDSKTFQTLGVHAEQLFYPIIVKLKAKLSTVQPGFIGGVKLACRTCAMVMEAAVKLVGPSKLILTTDAYGHYWKASGQHVPSPTFTGNPPSMVFSNNKKSIKVFDTEVPTSPERNDSDDDEDLNV